MAADKKRIEVNRYHLYQHHYIDNDSQPLVVLEVQFQQRVDCEWQQRLFQQQQLQQLL